MNEDTIARARAMIHEAGSVRKAALRLGVSYGALSDVARARHAHVSLRAETRVRLALGLPAVVLHTVPACPDCGGCHVAGRCKGRIGKARIVAPRKPFTRWADAPVRTLAAAIINREEL